MPHRYSWEDIPPVPTGKGFVVKRSGEVQVGIGTSKSLFSLLPKPPEEDRRLLSSKSDKMRVKRNQRRELIKSTAINTNIKTVQKGNKQMLCHLMAYRHRKIRQQHAILKHLLNVGKTDVNQLPSISYPTLQIENNKDQREIQSFNETNNSLAIIGGGDLQISDQPVPDNGKKLVSELIAAKNENLKLLSRLIRQETVTMELKEKTAADKHINNVQYTDLLGKYREKKEQVNTLRATCAEQTQSSNGLLDKLRSIQRKQRNTHFSGLSLSDAIPTSDAHAINSSHLAIQEQMLHQTKTVMVETQIVSGSYKCQIQKLKNENKKLNTHIDHLNSKMTSVKGLLRERTRHHEAEQRLLEEDELGIPCAPPDGVTISSVDRLRYTPRPDYKSFLDENLGVVTENRPSSIIVKELATKLHHKNTEVDTLLDDVESSAIVENVFDIRKQAGSKPNTTPIPTLPGDSIEGFLFLKTEQRTVRNLSWTEDITATWCSRTFASVYQLLEHRESKGNNTIEVNCYSLITSAIIVVSTCVVQIKRRVKSKRKRSSIRSEKVKTTSSSKPLKPITANLMNDYVTRWLQMEYPDDDARVKIAYNLFYYSKTYSRSEPLSRLFMLTCTGSLPLSVYSDVRTVLKGIPKMMIESVRNNQNAPFLDCRQTYSAVSSLLKNDSFKILIEARAAIASDFEGEIPPLVHYADRFDSNSKMSFLARFFATYIINQHLRFYKIISQGLIEDGAETFSVTSLITLLENMSNIEPINPGLFVKSVHEHLDLSSDCSLQRIVENLRCIPLNITDKLRNTINKNR